MFDHTVVNKLLLLLLYIILLRSKMNTPENKLLYTKNRLICKEVLEKFHVHKITATCNSKNIERFYDLTNK